jgi:hypothetical protein
MVQHEAWLIEPSGELSTVTQSLRLVVRGCDGFTRFLIFRLSAPDRQCGDMILSSGTAPDVNAAKAAARQTATRLETVLACRRQAISAGSYDSEPRQTERRA